MPSVRTPQRPLGLKADFEVAADVLETLRYIESFDLEGDEKGAGSSKLRGDTAAALEFKRFLALPVLYPQHQAFLFVPSLRLDALWHAFILNTPHYRAFCDRVYGHYLDHVPGKSRKETERAIRQGPMQFTFDSLSKAFDNVNKHFWKKIAFCGPCLIFRK